MVHTERADFTDDVMLSEINRILSITGYCEKTIESPPTESQTLLLTIISKGIPAKVFVFVLVVFSFLYPVLVYLLECRFVLLFFCSLMRLHQSIVDNVINVFFSDVSTM